jgi:outer membrane protein TolC
MAQRPNYSYRAKNPPEPRTRNKAEKWLGLAAKARHTITSRLARTFPTVRAAVRVADSSEAMLERTHTLLVSVQLALGNGVLDPSEIQQLEAEAARLRSQAEVLLEVVRDLTD